jgi:hypothetical protein
VPSRKDNIEIIREMTLAAAAAAAAPGEAVSTQVREDFANEQIKVRLRVGKRSGVFAVYNGDVERVQAQGAIRRKVEGLIRATLAELRG